MKAEWLERILAEAQKLGLEVLGFAGLGGVLIGREPKMGKLQARRP